MCSYSYRYTDINDFKYKHIFFHSTKQYRVEHDIERITEKKRTNNLFFFLLEQVGLSCGLGRGLRVEQKSFSAAPRQFEKGPY